MYDYGRVAPYVKSRRKKMKIKELLESLSEVKRYITEIRINGYKFGEFDEYKIKRNSFEGLNEYKELEVKSWKVSVEDYKVILIIHSEESQDQEEDEDSVEELTVGDVLSNICFDDENTIVIYNNTDSKVYDSDEDGVFVLCKLLCLDVKEYVQIHRGKHQTIEIHLKSY